MMKPLTAVLSVLLLATLSGCAMYDPRHPTTGSTYVDVRAQDQQLSEDRKWRAVKAKEWDDEEGRRQRVGLHRYFE
jgi:type IV pilus biogenesis protein CpaD/CtpE